MDASSVARMYLYVESRVTNGARSVAFSRISTMAPSVSCVWMMSNSMIASIVWANPSAADFCAATSELAATVFLKLNTSRNV